MKPVYNEMICKHSNYNQIVRYKIQKLKPNQTILYKHTTHTQTNSKSTETQIDHCMFQWQYFNNKHFNAENMHVWHELPFVTSMEKLIFFLNSLISLMSVILWYFQQKKMYFFSLISKFKGKFMCFR